LENNSQSWDKLVSFLVVFLSLILTDTVVRSTVTEGSGSCVFVRIEQSRLLPDVVRGH